VGISRNCSRCGADWVEELDYFRILLLVILVRVGNKKATANTIAAIQGLCAVFCTFKSVIIWLEIRTTVTILAMAMKGRIRLANIWWCVSKCDTSFNR